MRIAALIIALFAGLVGTAFIAFGLFDDVVLSLIGLGLHPAGAARLLLYSPTVLTLLGCGFALAAPLAGAAALLLAAFGWAGVALLAGKAAAFSWGLVIFAGAAFVMALVAGVLREPVEGYEADIEEPDASRRRLPAPARAPLPSERAALAAARAGTGIAMPGRPEPAVFAPSAENEPPLDIGAVPPGAARDEDDPSSRLTSAPPQAPFASRRAVEPPPQAEREGADDGEEKPDAPRYGGNRDYFGDPRERVPVFEPFDPEIARPRRPTWRRAVATVNLVLLAVLIGGAGVLIYLDHQRGPRSALFGTHGLLAGFDGHSSAAETAPVRSRHQAGDEIAALQPLEPVGPSAAADNTTEAPAPAAPASAQPPVNPDISPLAPPVPTIPGGDGRRAASTAGPSAPAAPPDNTAPDQQTPSAQVATAAAPSFDVPGPPAAGSPTTPPNSTMLAQADGTASAAPAAPLPNDPDAPIPAPPLPDRIPKPGPATMAPQPSAQAPAAPAAQPATPAQPASAQPDTPQAAAGPAAPQDEPAAAKPATPATLTTYADPFAYCEAVDTVDAPDKRYTGPAIPAAIASRLGAKTQAETAQLHWRCMSRNVMACRATGKTPVCDQLPTVDSMMAYCRAHPDDPKVEVPSGYWLCKNGKPQIPDGQKWPADRRGFYPPAWTPIPNLPAAKG